MHSPTLSESQKIRMASEQYLGKSEDGLGIEEDAYDYRMTENNESNHQKSLKNSKREQNQFPLLIDTEG